MRHLPVLLCGLILADALMVPAQAGVGARADEGVHSASGDKRPTQRVAKLDAAVTRPPAVDATEGACIAMIADDPAGAVDYAETWFRHRADDGAARCRALATIAEGDTETGAAMLDQLSRDPALPAPRRALMAGDAARAWLLAARTDRALAASGLAEGLDPMPDYVIEHARAALAAHQPALAIADLSPVLSAHATLADALVVRAAALRETGALDRAMGDIEAACRLEPDAPDALLERGILRERTGDLDGARVDWGRVVSVAPDTHEADLAQQDLALLDAGPEAR